MTRSKLDDKRPDAVTSGKAVVLSPDERRAQGKALRDAVSRESQGGWKPPRERRDPIEVLTASNEGRMPELVPIRFGRMLQSPFAFFRGRRRSWRPTWRDPDSGLRVQACGDCHLLNFGGFATPERTVVFDINDFDETLPAPWEWDLKRLAASLVIAARICSCSENEAARAATATVRAYRERMADYCSMRALDVWYDTITVERMMAEMRQREGQEAHRQAARRRPVEQSTAETSFRSSPNTTGRCPRIKDDPPLIFHPQRGTGAGDADQYQRSAGTLSRVAGRARARAVRPLPACATWR